MYSRDEFTEDCLAVFRNTAGNIVSIPEIGPVTMYEEPSAGFASAADPIFDTYMREEVIGSNYLKPRDWMPEALTVVSFFMPFTETVRKSNRVSKRDPSTEWLYARIEGQEFIGKFISGVREMLSEKGISSCIPSMDGRFGLKIEMTTAGDKPDFHVNSRWSERHAAYACGLGTFGLSRGLITERGMAGRFASIIIAEEFDPDERKYTGVYDYCIRCGACIRNCPVNAISLEYVKNNVKCNEYVEALKTKCAPRYGCGKCQVGVPCETRAPGLLVMSRKNRSE